MKRKLISNEFFKRFFMYSLAILFILVFVIGCTLPSSGGGGGGGGHHGGTTPPAPEINITQDITNIASGRGAFNFGNVIVGESSAAITFTIQNIGNANLTVSSPTISGADAVQFTIDATSLSSPVAGSGSTTFTITFSPTSVGGKTAIISIVNNDSDENPYTFRVNGNQTTKWNFLVYIDGDNNLEPYAIADINEMEQIGSNADVNILVLFDRTPGYDSSNGDWKGTRLYKVTIDADTVNILSELQTASPWGKSDDSVEVEMDDPNTLKDFIVYCQQNYPAQHTVLTLWNHGDGAWPRFMTKKIKGSQKTKKSKISSGADRGICWDDTSGGGEFDCLTHDEVASALSNARAETSQKIEVINMDACLMQMLEVAYEWKNEADYLVGSEEVVPGVGNDYDVLLGHLTANPSMSPLTLATTLVDDYYSYYNSNGGDTTYSAIDLGYVNTFISTFKTFATRLKTAAILQIPDIRDAGFSCTYYYYWEYIDLYDFCVHLESGVTNYPDLVTAATSLKTAIGTLVVHHHETGLYATDSNFYSYGISICLPYDLDTWDFYSGANRYVKLLLAIDTDWNEFMYKNAYYGTNGSIPY